MIDTQGQITLVFGYRVHHGTDNWTQEPCGSVMEIPGPVTLLEQWVIQRELVYSSAIFVDGRGLIQHYGMYARAESYGKR